MAATARERLARLLRGSEPVGSFSAELIAPARLFELEVSGVGPVSLPIRAPVARKLISVARPAMFGRGAETLTDTGVRDTWELTPDQVSLGGSGWTSLLEGALEHFRDALGLPGAARLVAEPHSMLVYGKGQFFLPHQDSEKHDAMVGTLVVSLPSTHNGGELVVEHAGESRTYRASKSELALVAFYSDCRHEVTPVRSGYRVTLTFNLLAFTEASTGEPGSVTELAQCLTEHFATPATSRYGGRDLGMPNRLVFLLDHEYTQRGLGWSRLKGVDAERAASVRAAAEEAGCEAVLALADVRETWDADSDDGSYYCEVTEDYELHSLIDDEITLGWWTNGENGGESISLYVPDHEVCALTASVELKPYQSEYEGYMGNYGNTVDRWYRRAAIVMWPRERAFAARAEAGSGWALHELRDCIERGDVAGARGAAESLAPFWKTTAPQPELLGVALAVASGLDAAETAAMLLEPFRIEALARDDAEALAEVAGRYGEDWTADVLRGWFGGEHRIGADRDGWIETLPGLCEALRAAGAPQVARLLTGRTWYWVDVQLRSGLASGRADIRRPRLQRLGSPLARLFEAADETQRDEIRTALRERGDTVLECVMSALRSADGRRSAGLEALAHDCAALLDTIIARPRRAGDDWSIDWTGCGCELCKTLEDFLHSRSERRFEWPLAAEKRLHVHSQIDSADLPVQHQTRKQGRPYTLVLTKAQALFTRPEEQRQQALADLAWIRSSWGGGEENSGASADVDELER
ncbi:2OG-Fe(II) oxygenase [Saccharopolyspora sp. NPDC002376]